MEDTLPIMQNFDCPIHQKDQAEADVDQILAQGIIMPSNSTLASPMVLVKKKDGSLSFCLDYWCVNVVIRKVSSTIPSLYSLGPVKFFFSTLELASNYLSMPDGMMF